MLFCNGYSFLSFEGEWDDDGLPRPAIDEACLFFSEFLSGNYTFKDSWRVKRKHMLLNGCGKYGRILRNPGERGPLRRAREAGFEFGVGSE